MGAGSLHPELWSIGNALRGYLESLKESGVSGVPQAVRTDDSDREEPSSMTARRGSQTKSDPSSFPSAPISHQPLSAEPMVQSQRQPAESAVLHSISSLAALRDLIGDCRRCKLCEQRSQIVFGAGNPDAELAFIGEGPGYDEDKTGEPFVGRAGQLLTEIITKGMKMRREDVYIANVVKCRPPHNRNPELDEIAACEPFLRQQLAIVQPRIIVALGAFASQTLLKTKTPISRLRGVWHSYNEVKLMPTLHPAYLLRNPKEKRLVWEDIKAVLREMGRL